MVTGGVVPLGSLSVTGIFPDPHDTSALYLSTSNQGLFYSYNGGENWFQPTGLTAGKITDVAVDTSNKCVIYATLGNRILKSSDCNRSYQEVFIDTRPIEVTAIETSFENHLYLFAGTSRGEVIRSIDGGKSWNTIFNHRKLIRKLLLDPKNSQVLYAVVEGGMYRSRDSGFSWDSLNDGLRQFSGALKIDTAIFNPSKAESLIIVNRYGLMRTEDGGNSWQPYNLITPPLTAQITAVAVNPKDDREVYYTTETTFYKSEDGGQNWIVRRMPTPARPSTLHIDPSSPHILYMATHIPTGK